MYYRFLVLLSSINIELILSIDHHHKCRPFRAFHCELDWLIFIPCFRAILLREFLLREDGLEILQKQRDFECGTIERVLSISVKYYFWWRRICAK